MKVVITRDSDGYMEIWPIETLESLWKDEGVWVVRSKHNRIIGIVGWCYQFKCACKLLGFTPRKGRKYVKNIIVKD